MLTVKATPHLAGLAISGDYDDLQRLYDALMAVVDDYGDDNEDETDYEMPALYILALCYELRHAHQGERWLEFIDNGFSEEVQQRQKSLGPQRNVYYQTRVAVPEILFDLMVLDDFIKQYRHKTPCGELDRDITCVRWFQAEATQALCGLLDEKAAARLVQLMHGPESELRFSGYYTQYVDYQTSRYLKAAPDKRLAQILPLARRFHERGASYMRLAEELEETAEELSCSISDLQPVDEPKELNDEEW